MWCIAGLGVSVGYHRHFAHRSFHARPLLRYTLGFAAATAGQGPVVYWVALHRKHHRYSDRAGDPHSPIANRHASTSPLRGWLHSHFGWIAESENAALARYAVDLLNEPLARRLVRWYYPLFALGLAVPAIIGWIWYGTPLGALKGLLWGGLLRVVLGNQIIWSVNSFCHLAGSQPHATGDASRNNAWVSLLAFGEGWHNNHHADPTSARFGHRRWELDPGWWLVKLLQRIGLATSVRVSALAARGDHA